MSYRTTPQADAALSACAEALRQPTKDNVAKIGRMTLSSGSIPQKIENALFARVVDPDKYELFEIEHSLIVILQCLFIGSDGFVAFFKDRAYAVASLINYTRSPRDSAAVTRIQSRAKPLLAFLENNRLLQRQRNNTAIPPAPSVPTSRRSSFKPSSSANDPPRGRNMRTWRDWRSDASSGAPSISPYLPTPEPSPERGSSLSGDESEASQEDEVEESSGIYSVNYTDPAWEDVEQAVRKAIEVSPVELTRATMDSMANMTFDSEQRDTLVAVLVETLLGNNPELAATYRPLLKALQIIKHCLHRGSDEFATSFREIRATIVRDHPVPAIRQLAAEILDSLGDSGTQNNAPRSPPTSPRAPNTSDVSFSSSTDSTPITLSDPVKDLTAFVTSVGDHPIASGGYALIYQATLSVGSRIELVAKKILTPRNITRSRFERRINREIGAWTRLSHPNIAELYGITHETNGNVGLISHLYENGNIDEYLRVKNPCDPMHVLNLMIDITLGVEYLHAQGIVHGDIKGSNIMVDEEGHAKLIDFGLSRIRGENGNTTSGPGISWAFAAPELLLGEEDEPAIKTNATDVYAIAVTFVQIMSGRAPFARMNALAIVNAVKLWGTVPERPMPDEPCITFIPTDDFWALLLCCWSPRPGDRPAVSTLRERLPVVGSSSA